MKISLFFSMEEVEHSDTAARLGIDNTSPDNIQDRITYTAQQMDKVRALLAVPIMVDSWYRSLELNRLLKSKDTSQHRLGEAVDFISPAFGTPEDICRAILAAKTIPFDQMIFEHTWVHCSFIIPPRTPRGEVLTLMPDGSYARGIISK